MENNIDNITEFSDLVSRAMFLHECGDSNSVAIMTPRMAVARRAAMYQLNYRTVESHRSLEVHRAEVDMFHLIREGGFWDEYAGMCLTVAEHMLDEVAGVSTDIGRFNNAGWSLGELVEALREFLAFAAPLADLTRLEVVRSSWATWVTEFGLIEDRFRGILADDAVQAALQSIPTYENGSSPKWWLDDVM